MRYSESERRRIVVQLGDYTRLDEASKALGVSERTLRDWAVELTGSRPAALLGKKAVVAPIRPNSECLKILIQPDTHIPYHHEGAFRTFITVLKEWKPDWLVMLGDMVDFYSVASYRKDPGRALTFKDEVKIANETFNEIGGLANRVSYLEGNHEKRLSSYIADKAPELYGIVHARELLRIEERGWTWTPYGEHLSIGKLYFTHDVGFAGVNAARQNVQAFGASIICGHTHRAATHYEGTVTGERHVGHTMGWLGDPDCIDYQHRAIVKRNSQHGFGIAYVFPDGNHWSHFVPIIDGVACVEGVRYQG